jgi:RNA polymerase sigma factor (sigma-70 family)
MNSPDEIPLHLRCGDGRMPVTHWSVVISAGNGADRALQILCQTYWYPVYAFIRRWPKDAEQAKDLTQAFFVHLLQNRRIARADPAKGKFRSFLLASARNYLLSQPKRPPEEPTPFGLAIEWHDAENRFQHEPTASEAAPDKIFEQSFTMHLIQQTLDTLKLDCADLESKKRFDVLATLLAGKNPQMSQKQAAELLGISEEAVAKAVFDLRNRFKRTFREIVRQTVATYEELDDEIQYHMNVFSR